MLWKHSGLPVPVGGGGACSSTGVTVESSAGSSVDSVLLLVRMDKKLDRESCLTWYSGGCGGGFSALFLYRAACNNVLVLLLQFLH